jgi:hypothetical protein
MSYPKMFYASDGRTTVVETQAQEDALSGAWYDNPADFGLITAPSVEQMGMLTTEYASGVMQATVNPTAYAPNGILTNPPSGN